MEWPQRISDIARSECDMPVRFGISSTMYRAYVLDQNPAGQDPEESIHPFVFATALLAHRGERKFSVSYRTPDGTTMRLDGLTEDQSYEQFKDALSCAGFTLVGLK